MATNDFVSAKKELQEAKKFSVKVFFQKDYIIRGFLRKNYPFILVLLLLSMFNIWNGYRYVAENKRLKKEQKELVMLKFKSMEIQAELMKFSRQSQILQKIKERELGLELPASSPIILKQNKK